MASAMYNNRNVSFLVTRPFRFKGKQYALGDEFPKKVLRATNTNPEVLIRTRHLAPVVDEGKLKPRHMHREVKTRNYVLKKLGKIDWDTPVPEDESSQIGKIIDKHTQEVEAEREIAEEAEPFNVSEHTVDEVVAFVNQYPDLLDDVVKAEKASGNRVTLVNQLEKLRMVRS